MNFIKDYLFYNEGNEVNQNYHLWTALSILSAVVSRHVWIKLGYFTLYPNLYVVLLGPAGNGKTTALGGGYRMLNEIGSIPTSADCQSCEDLVRMLAKDEAQQAFLYGQTPIVYTQLSLLVSELSQFIGIDPSKMLDFFVTIYDRDDRYEKRTIKHGPQTIIRPYITLLACTVPEWITTYLKTDVITGGFTRRCVFVMEDWSERRVPWPEVLPQQQEAWDRCVAWCKSLLSLSGDVTLTPDARKWWDHWYTTRSISRDLCTAAFDKTRPALVLKIALLLQLSVSHDLVIDLDKLELAEAQTAAIMDRLPQVFGAVGRNELAQVSVKLLNILRRAGAPVPEREIKKTLYNDVQSMELISIIQHLIDTGSVQRTITQNGQAFLGLAAASGSATK